MKPGCHETHLSVTVLEGEPLPVGLWMSSDMHGVRCGAGSGSQGIERPETMLERDFTV